MRAAVLDRPGRLRVEERQVPEPGPGEVLVRISAVGVCGSDTHYYREGRIGPYVVEQPLVLGHEPSGRIEALGPGVANRSVGQRVSLEPGVPDPLSVASLAGHYNLDPAVRFFATPPIDGAFAEYVVHPAASCHPVPDDVSDESAALLEPLSVALAACGAAGIGLGATVLVAGAGPIGLLISQVASLSGATVTLTDVREERLEPGRRFGANELLYRCDDAGARGRGLPAAATRPSSTFLERKLPSWTAWAGWGRKAGASWSAWAPTRSRCLCRWSKGGN